MFIKLNGAMRSLPTLGAAAIAMFVAATALNENSQAALDPTGVFTGGEAGFVVTEFGYALPEGEAGASCPNGLTTGYANVGDVMPASARASFQRGADETEGDYSRRTYEAMFGGEDNLCFNPQAGAPDPNFRTVLGANAALPGGIDLDGRVARANAAPAPGTCAHDDFRAANGDRGVDNQFYRVIGCGQAFQPDGQSRDLSSEMLTGSWGILLNVRGVDDVRNDPDVEVSFYANADPIQLGVGRPLAHATYSPVEDPRFRATARGRIVNGVLTTDPVDVRFYSVFNTVRTERPLRDARVRMTFTPDGGLEGFLAGYTPVEEMYDVQFGFRQSTRQTGEPASLTLRNTRSIGSAITFGQYTCQGAYQAIQRLADGHRDPETGSCTSISTQYLIRAAPAFVAAEAD